MPQPLFVLLPGLNDELPTFAWFYALVVKRWRRKGLNAVFVPLRWKDSENLENKIERVVSFIATQQEDEVVLVGCSAGSAIAMLLFQRLTPKVRCVVSVSGYLEVAPATERFANEIWYQAATLAKQVTDSLSRTQRKQIVTFYPSKDQTVAPSRARVAGARNILMSVRGHLPSIVIGLWQYVPMVVPPLLQKMPNK